MDKDRGLRLLLKIQPEPKVHSFRRSLKNALNPPAFFLPTDIYEPAAACFLGAFLGFKLRKRSEKIAQFFKAVVPGIELRRTDIDFLPYASEIRPA